MTEVYQAWERRNDAPQGPAKWPRLVLVFRQMDGHPPPSLDEPSPYTEDITLEETLNRSWEVDVNARKPEPEDEQAFADRIHNHKKYKPAWDDFYQQAKARDLIYL